MKPMMPNSTTRIWKNRSQCSCPLKSMAPLRCAGGALPRTRLQRTEAATERVVIGLIDRGDKPPRCFGATTYHLHNEWAPFVRLSKAPKPSALQGRCWAAPSRASVASLGLGLWCINRGAARHGVEQYTHTHSEVAAGVALCRSVISRRGARTKDRGLGNLLHSQPQGDAGEKTPTRP